MRTRIAIFSFLIDVADRSIIRINAHLRIFSRTNAFKTKSKISEIVLNGSAQKKQSSKTRRLRLPCCNEFLRQVIDRRFTIYLLMFKPFRKATIAETENRKRLARHPNKKLKFECFFLNLQQMALNFPSGLQSSLCTCLTFVHLLALLSSFQFSKIIKQLQWDWAVFCGK